jgi:hypothetical protein
VDLKARSVLAELDRANHNPNPFMDCNVLAGASQRQETPCIPTHPAVLAPGVDVARSGNVELLLPSLYNWVPGTTRKTCGGA